MICNSEKILLHDFFALMKNAAPSSSILICFGTRPEVIKLAPVIKELTARGISFRTLFTGQHDELFSDVADLIPEPDIDLEIMEREQTPSDVFEAVSNRVAPILRSELPGLVIVQGDTSTAAAVAQAAFSEGISIGHVEAGLRTYDLESPRPEEHNRQLISKIAHFNWAPTETAARNLHKEGVSNVMVTGNTVIDSCSRYNFPISYGNKVLVTLHRRENFGDRMETMFRQLDELAVKHGDLEFIFPMHPNPQVQRHRDLLGSLNVVQPLQYLALLKLLSDVRFVISDSGGIQEECAVFHKKVLVCRDKTERPEGVAVGLAKVVGTDIAGNFAWANDFPEWEGENPYGDGKAAGRIVDSIVDSSYAS
jgi:UDP-N-acetylglucosamine 2-epimerase (non-hydrolysing)|tara:strand:+ start:2980 stop:4077 length:1098 start_codon:yes stop_codon:yes gene_type:complete